MAKKKASMEDAGSDLPPSLLGPPHRIVVGGVVVCAAAAGLQLATQSVEPGWSASIAVCLAVAGLIATGFGLSLQPRSVTNLLFAAIACAFSVAGIHPAWDSMRLLPAVGAGVAVVVAVLLLLPQTLRRLIVSGLVVYHFMGVFSAITSPAPSSWVSAQAWVRIFRPHLVFTYINNAYQFYSPEPGPASLLWFCVEFDNGEKTWYKVPRKPETHLDPLAVQFFRRLSITTGATPVGSGNVSPALLQRRSVRTDIPFYPGSNAIEVQFQYSPPDEYMKRTLSSYARHVADVFGADRVTSVKVYRVLHRMLTQPQFASGVDPFHKASYLPFFMGDYNAQGELKNPDDGLLYWLIPIIPLDRSLDRGQKAEPLIDNYVEKHAGADPFKF